MNKIQKFNIQIEEPCLENYANPPEDPLGELTEFEMGIRRFCFECNYQVSIQIGDKKKKVFFDPDICMLLEDNLPQKIQTLSQGQVIEIVFWESSLFTIKLVPSNETITCTLSELGYSNQQENLNLEKKQVISVLNSFLSEIMNKAVVGGYITSTQTEEFLIPICNKII